MAVSLLSLGWVSVSFARPGWIGKITPAWLLVWNLLFTLTMTILAHLVPFPPAPDFPAAVVGSPTWLQQLPLVLILLLYPVIFVDLRVFASRIHERIPAPRDLVPGVLLGSLSVIILVYTFKLSVVLSSSS
jgi:hypothetical protein